MANILNHLIPQTQVDPNQINNSAPAVSGTNPAPFSPGINLGAAADPQQFIFNAAVILLWALGVAAVLTFIYAGVKYITAGGDPEKAESAKKIIIGSIIGMLIVIGSYLILNTAITALTDTTGKTPQQILNQTY